MTLVTMSEVAEALGVTKQALANRKRRYDAVPFPDPVDYVVKGISPTPRYRSEDIERWYRTTQTTPRKCRCACHRSEEN